MLIPLILLALAVPSSPPAVDRDCDDKCAVLVSTLKWAIAQVPDEKRSRTFFDVGEAGYSPIGEETPEVRAWRRVLAETATGLGVPAVRKAEDERFLRCSKIQNSAECEAGTTWITVFGPSLVSHDEAVAKVKTQIASDRGSRSPFHGTGQEVRLRRVDGRWEVVDSHTYIHAN